MHSRGYAAKDTQPRLRPRLHSQPCTANVTQPRLCPRLHIHACIAKVTQSRIRSQGYAAKVTQPRLRPRLHCQDYTSPGDIIQVSKHPLFGVARWSHTLLHCIHLFQSFTLVYRSRMHDSRIRVEVWSASFAKHLLVCMFGSRSFRRLIGR